MKLLLSTKPLKSFAASFDWVLLVLVLGIATIGIFNLTSIANILTKPLHNTQLLWLVLGIVFFAVPCATIDYRFYDRFATVIYVAGNALLLIVLFFGTDFNGARRWLNLFGFFHFQPSELMKIGVVIFTAKFFASREHSQNYTIRALIPLFAAVALPMFLIFLEPDLGTALLIGLVAAVMILFEGMKKKSLAILICCMVALAPLAWSVMQDYQRTRVLAFLQIEDDPYGSDWQVKNSVIAVGAGGLTGRGYGQSTQVQKGFVPEPENDFALANWAEEHGFAGVAGLLFLYFALLLWSLRIAKSARDRFGMLLAVGISAIIFWQVLVNTAMVVRWAPVVGITLPLISYGGSSMMSMMICVGILMNVSMRRFTYKPNA
ncbi:MAG: rod shape-determining protein RodA [Proteobacteria bacterium]|nr:rod shape-determining protein RodA [Pseudomonadota bacterium]